MNYYAARRRAEPAPPAPGIYDYTRRNDDLITPEGFCRQKVSCSRAIERIERADFATCQESCPVCHGEQFVPNPAYCGGHPTPEEAEECFARYILSCGVREENYGDWTGCDAQVLDAETRELVKCDLPTRKGLRGEHPLGQHMALCDEDCTTEIFEGCAPTRAGTITASY